MRASLLITVVLASACRSDTSLRVATEVADLHPKAAVPLPGRVALVLYDPRRPEDNPMIGDSRGDVTSDWVAALRESGLFREVHYPVLSTHRFEMTMEIEQKGSQLEPTETRMLKSLTFLTLCLAGPFCTYSMDSHVEAVVRLKVRSETVGTYKATSDARFSYHFHVPMPDTTKSFADTIAAAHAQLNRQMIDDRDQLAAAMTAPPKAPAP